MSCVAGGRSHCSARGTGLRGGRGSVNPVVVPSAHPRSPRSSQAHIQKLTKDLTTHQVTVLVCVFGSRETAAFCPPSHGLV